jgi:ubiquinone/menaquinone biosynthesis C-methylase UbiE
MESFNTPHVKIEYHEETHILHLTWVSFTPTKEYREALEQALKLMQKHHVNHWIFDQRNAEVISPQDQKWVVEDWTPRVVRSVGKNNKSAVILAKNIFGELSIKNLVDTTSEVVETKYFQEIESAKKWLLGV